MIILHFPLFFVSCLSECRINMPNYPRLSFVTSASKSHTPPILHFLNVNERILPGYIAGARETVGFMSHFRQAVTHQCLHCHGGYRAFARTQRNAAHSGSTKCLDRRTLSYYVGRLAFHRVPKRLHEFMKEMVKRGRCSGYISSGVVLL